MTTAIFDRFALPNASSVFHAARSLFNASDEPSSPVVEMTNIEAQALPAVNECDIELEKEAEPYEFTETELEDSDMIDRVRSALYSD